MNMAVVRNREIEIAQNEPQSVNGRILLLSSVARWFAIISLVMIFLAALYLVYVMFFDFAELNNALEQPELPDGFVGGLPASVKILLLLLLFLESLPSIIGFYTANKLFSAFKEGEIFTVDTANRVSLIGWVVFVLPVVSLVISILVPLFLGIFKTAGFVSISIDFNEGDMMAMVFGLLFVILGRVMMEAVKISDENQQFV